EGVRAEELTQGLRAPEEAGRGAARQVDGGRRDVEAVALGYEHAVEGEPYGSGADVGAVALRPGREREAGGGAQGAAQPALGAVTGDEPGVRPEREQTDLQGGHFPWLGNHVDHVDHVGHVRHVRHVSSQSFTAPPRPETSRRCTSTKKTSTGIVITVDAAMTP